MRSLINSLNVTSADVRGKNILAELIEYSVVSVRNKFVGSARKVK